MKTFKAQWFRYSNGRCLSADESFGGIKKFDAPDYETAVEIAKEAEGADSEIEFSDRVTVWEVFPFELGDRVEVLRGDKKGIQGTVQPHWPVHGDNFTVWLDNFSTVDKFTFMGENLKMIKSIKQVNAELKMLENGVDPYVK